MKTRNRLKKLERRQKWFDENSGKVNANIAKGYTRPGSQSK